MNTRRSLALLWLLAPLLAGPAEAVTVPGDFPNIQSAINAVVSGALPDGTVINLLSGQTYFERLGIFNNARAFTLRGGGSPSMLHGAGGGTVITMINATGAIRFENLIVTGGVGGQTTGGGLVLENSSPTFVNVTFQQNTSVGGGAGVLTRSNATFMNCRFFANSAQLFGGAFVLTVGSRPTFMSSVFDGNVSGLSSAIGSGGAIHSNDSSPTLIATTVTNNTASFAGGGIFHLGVYGSANGTAVLRLEDSVVSNNTARRFDNAQNPAEGGGVHVENNATAQVIRSRLENNDANTGGGINAFRGRLEIQNSVIQGNQAPDPLNVGGFGGGVQAQSNGATASGVPGTMVVITDSVVRNNSSRTGGGVFVSGDRACCDDATATKGVLTVTDSLVSGNTATQSAGGIFSDRGAVTVTGSHVLNNANPSGDGFGGGLLAVSSALTLTTSTIAGNTAASFGGGLFIDVGTSVNIANNNIYRNTATSGNGGGGLFVGNVVLSAGTVQNNQIADNTGFQIREQACGAGTILTYSGNSVANQTAAAEIYNKCGGPHDFAAFNALTGNANNDTAPSFNVFLATPDFVPAVLSWAVARAGSITVNGVAQSASNVPVGTLDVATAGTYTLDSDVAGPLMVTVTVPPAPFVSPYDFDRRADTAIYRGVTGQWLVTRSAGLTSTITWGDPALNDIPLTGDYDGDGQGDIAVYRGATGQWFVLLSGGGAIIVTWGFPPALDQPVVGDFDGDGKADLTVYRGVTGQWFSLLSGGGAIIALTWGDPAQLDVPAPGDFDGDGKTDITVYRRRFGQWFALLSGGGAIILTWGDPAQLDVPVAGKYDADNKSDIAVYRRASGQWFVLNSTGGATILTWGDPALSDIPVPADYDGDGRTDITVYRPPSGQWFILRSSGGLTLVETGIPVAGDQPVPLQH